MLCLGFVTAFFAKSLILLYSILKSVVSIAKPKFGFTRARHVKVLVQQTRYCRTLSADATFAMKNVELMFDAVHAEEVLYQPHPATIPRLELWSAFYCEDPTKFLETTL